MLVRQAYDRARALVSANQVLLEKLVERLLATETLSESDLVSILGPRTVHSIQPPSSA